MSDDDDGDNVNGNLCFISPYMVIRIKNKYSQMVNSGRAQALLSILNNEIEIKPVLLSENSYQRQRSRSTSKVSKL